MNSRERFLAACKGEPVDRPPVWLMRQAGRYLPEYREIRKGRTFWDMVRSPELACEVTLQPIRRYDMDAAILFCDILVVQDAMGIDVRYEAGGISLSPMIEYMADLERLKPVNANRAFDYVAEAMERLCTELHPHKAVLGFAGAPFTLAAYLVEGGPSKTVNKLKRMALTQPELYQGIIERITDVVADLLALQIEAGADMVQLFDTWAWHLHPDDYARMAMPWTQKVIERLKPLGAPVALYLRNAAGHLEVALESGCQVLSVDNSLRLADARDRVAGRAAIQGNMDPAWLTAPPDRIRAMVHQAIATMEGQGYIVNLGQGLVPDSPIEGVGAFVKAVQDWGV